MNRPGSSLPQSQNLTGLSQPGHTTAVATTPNTAAMPQSLQRPREASVSVHSFSEQEPNPDSQSSGSGNSQSYRQSSQEWSLADYDGSQESGLTQPEPAIPTHSSDRIRVSKADSEAFEEVTLCARRQFIATLDNKRVTWPVEQVFPGLSATREMYKNAVARVRDLYKTWKNKSLDLALRKFNNWILTLTPRQVQRIRGSTDFVLVQQAIASQFEFSWVFDVFPWAQQVLCIDDCSSLGRDWLQCK